MPNIKDQSTVEAIAREFTSNGRNKTRAMIAIGYDEAYSDSGKGHKSVYGNLRVIEAIKAIDDKTRAESVASRKQRQEFWTNTMNNDPLMINKLRASELLGRSEADFTDNINSQNIQKPALLTPDEVLELKQAAIKLTG